MNKLHLISNVTVFLVIALCLWQTSITVEAAFIPTALPDKSFRTDNMDFNRLKNHQNSDERLSSKSYTTQPDDSSSSAKKFDSGKDKGKDGFDENFGLFNSFMPFPFFPFPFHNLKRHIFHLNSTEKRITAEEDSKFAGNRSEFRPNPFFFVDIEFDTREMPVRNQSNVSKFLRKVSMDHILPKRTLFEEPKSKASTVKDRDRDATFDISNDNWSLFDNSALLPPDVEEFFPKSDFLLFDSPFHRKHNKRLIRYKRGSSKPVIKNDLNFLMDVFDEALSRTKKEMERAAPFWDFENSAGKRISMEENENDGNFMDEHRHLEERKLQPKYVDKYRSDIRGTRGIKRSAFESMRQKTPVILGKVVEIGEIHFGDDYSKNRKKRRGTSVLGKKGNEETSINVLQMHEPFKLDTATKDNGMYIPLYGGREEFSYKLHKENGPEQLQEIIVSKDASTPEFPDTKIIELLTEWDPRALEQKEEIKNQPKDYLTSKENFEARQKNAGMSEAIARKVKAPTPKEEGFRNVGHTPELKEPPKNDIAPEILSSEMSPGRVKGEVEELSRIANATPNKEEVIKNIRHVIGQFFSMIKKFGDSKSYYGDKESSESNDFNWMEWDEHRGQEQLSKDTMKRLRRDGKHPDDVELRERKTQNVADLNYLFLTVTLPTMFAFTLLLMVCFFNLRVRGWLCTKLFKPRNVYVVEGDANKVHTTVESNQVQMNKEDVKSAEVFEVENKTENAKGEDHLSVERSKNTI